MTQFKIVIKRDRGGRLLRRREYVIDVDDDDGGFTIDVHHLGDFKKGPICISGFIGTEDVSTTVEFEGSPRVKRVTKKLTTSRIKHVMGKLFP